MKNKELNKASIKTDKNWFVPTWPAHMWTSASQAVTAYFFSPEHSNKCLDISMLPSRLSLSRQMGPQDSKENGPNQTPLSPLKLFPNQRANSSAAWNRSYVGCGWPRESSVWTPHILLHLAGAPCQLCITQHGTQLHFLFQVLLLPPCWFSSSPRPSTCGSLRRSPWGLPRRSG